MTADSLPDPFAQIRRVGTWTVAGANFWSSRPVTRLDVAVGAYEEISSADVPGFTDALLGALPGLWEHRCSIGERGGFVTRLRRGTYAAHIAEHLALELQTRLGHRVGYGRARGGDRPGEYTVAFEHRHAGVGARAAERALEWVQRAFAGMPLDADAALAELAAVAATPAEPAPGRRVLCGITGGGDRAAVRAELLRRGAEAAGEVVEVPPAQMLITGLPYARSAAAVILDAAPDEVAPRYREPENAARLVSVVADATPRGAVVVVPARAWEVQDRVRDAGCRLAVFAAEGRVSGGDARVAHATASAAVGRVVIESRGRSHDAGPLRPDAPAAPQMAAALAWFALREAADPDPAFTSTWNAHAPVV